MGNESGKFADQYEYEDLLNIPQRQNSEGSLSEREASAAWYRYGIDITDVYDVIDVLGQGHMGEVFTVRRKITGHHTRITRQKSKASSGDLLRLIEEHEKKDAKEKKKKSTLSTPLSPLKGVLKKTTKKTKKVMKKIGSYKDLTVHDDADSSLTKYIITDDEQFPDAPRDPTNCPKLRRKSSFSSSLKKDTEMRFSIQQPQSCQRQQISLRKGVHFQRTFAVKTILTSRVNKDQVQELVNEIMIMRKLDHPYIVKMYEVYHVKRKLWLVTELLQGGDVSSRKLNEHETKRIIEQILCALVYLHRMGIVHRDIKMENILFENRSKNATVRLIDFGLSRTFDRRTNGVADYIRTPYTMSPEMTSKKSSIKTDKNDVWAVGVMTFIMLSGEFPFIKCHADLQNEAKIERLKQARFHYGCTWKGRGITNEAKEFLEGCLKADPNERWTAKKALEHLQTVWGPKVDSIWDEWQAKVKENTTPEFVSSASFDEEDDDEGGINASSDSEEPLDTEARIKYIKKHVQNAIKQKRAEGPINVLGDSVKLCPDVIERYTNHGMLKKTILMAMANTMDRGEVKKIRDAFVKIDKNDTGTIAVGDLLDAFKEVSPDINEDRVKELFAGVDRDKSGQIHYAEFLAALAESHGLVTLDRLQEAFDRIDTDGKGYIDHGDLKSILGNDYDEETVNKMIQEGDFKKNNKIDYEELLQLMFSDPIRGDEMAGTIASSQSFGSNA